MSLSVPATTGGGPGGDTGEGVSLSRALKESSIGVMCFMIVLGFDLLLSGYCEKLHICLILMSGKGSRIVIWH